MKLLIVLVAMVVFVAAMPDHHNDKEHGKGHGHELHSPGHDLHGHGKIHEKKEEHHEEKVEAQVQNHGIAEIQKGDQGSAVNSDHVAVPKKDPPHTPKFEHGHHGHHGHDQKEAYGHGHH